MPQSGTDTLCIAQDNFVIAAARQCRTGQTPAPFTQINPTQTDDGNLVAYLAEDSEYDDEQARLAGIQRLLVIAGYDAAPIDGVDGPKTQAALAAFLKSRGLAADVVQSQNFFTTMIDAVQSPSATGLTWCNDTPHKIMAAVATDDGKTVTSRGWYRIDPGKCLHPDVTGQPKQIFSFAEAVDNENRTVKFRDKPLNWGGATQLCTRESKFEINEQGDCGTRGLAATALPPVDMSERRQDAALCDAVMERFSIVVPAKAGTHNPRPVVDLAAQAKATATVLHRQIPRRMGPGFRRDDVERAMMTIRPRLRPCRHLGVRPRQHAVSASRQSVAAGRCADRRVRQRTGSKSIARGSAPRSRRIITAATAPPCAA